MNNKSFWIGYIIVLVFMQVYTYAIHGVWLSETYQALAAVFRPEAEMFDMMWMMTVGSLGSVLLFCYIFTRGYEGKGAGEGARYGALIGVLLSIPQSVDQYVVYPLPSDLAIKWFVTTVIGFVIAGMLFALVYRPAPERPHVAGQHQL
jgi:hypothetical protein